MWVQYLLLKGSHKILVEKLMMKRYQHEVALIFPPWGRRICSLQISHLQNMHFIKTYLNEVAKHFVSWHLMVHYQFIHHLGIQSSSQNSLLYLLFPKLAECIFPNHSLSLGEGSNCSFESPSLLFLSTSSLKTMKYKPVYYPCIHLPIKYLLYLFMLISFPLNL